MEMVMNPVRAQTLQSNKEAMEAAYGGTLSLDDVRDAHFKLEV